jgi:heme/copper-type cytochrome/quinol oxidase subunit 2
MQLHTRLFAVIFFVICIILYVCSSVDGPPADMTASMIHAGIFKAVFFSSAITAILVLATMAYHWLIIYRYTKSRIDFKPDLLIWLAVFIGSSCFR